MTIGDPWGSGLKLDENWDFEIDETGDLRATYGLDELQKDLALRTATEIDKEIGVILDKNAMAEIRLLIRQALDEDIRVNRIVDITTTNLENEPDKVRVDVKVVSNEGETYNLTEDFEI